MNSKVSKRNQSVRISKKCFQQGFSLLEILVAFAILTLSLGVLLNIFSGGVRRAAVSEEYQHAITIAQSKLASVGVDEELRSGEIDGVIEDKYNWSVRTEIFNIDDDIDQDTLPVDPYQVTVTVEWEAGKDFRHIELTTLRLSKKDES